MDKNEPKFRVEGLDISEMGFKINTGDAEFSVAIDLKVRSEAGMKKAKASLMRMAAQL